VVLRTLVQPFPQPKASFFWLPFSFSFLRSLHIDSIFAVRGSGKSILLNSHHDHNDFRNRRCRAQLPSSVHYSTYTAICTRNSVVHLNKTCPASFSLLLYHRLQSYQVNDEKTLTHNHENTTSTIDQKISSDYSPPPPSPPYSITSTPTTCPIQEHKTQLEVYITQHNPETPAQCTPPSQLHANITLDANTHTHTPLPTPSLPHQPISHPPTAHPLLPHPIPRLKPPPPPPKNSKTITVLYLFHLNFTEEKDK